MRKFWLIAKHEYLKIVRQKSFLVGTLGMPVLIILVMAVSILVALGQRGNLPLGYVDHTGLLSESVVLPAPKRGEEPPVAIRAFADEAAAQAALEAGIIRAYYVVPADYVQSGRVQLFFLNKRPGERVQEDFADFLRVNLLATYPPAVQQRLLEGSSVTFRSIDGGRELESDSVIGFIVPFVAAFFFIFAVLNSGSYMLQAVTDEKENRTVEVLATSIRPEELIGGKALGLMSVGLTQLGIWVLTSVIALFAASFFVPEVRMLRVPWSFLGVVALFFVPAYALIAGLMTAIGGMVTDLRQGQQITGILNLFFSLPFFFMALMMAKPNSPLIIALTLFPTTAFVTITMRWAMTTVPLWQLGLSLVFLVTSAVVSVWLAARIFRLGMLQYGQPLKVKTIVAALRNDNGLRTQRL
ncbi:MAG TPA: ABC transporter permease [Anaerolineae bacterium]|nr:ABC transporter permease [Anaerolineae bacterium]HQK12454.1 ABC transporter permease [Anaerolineae bacterium]